MHYDVPAAAFSPETAPASTPASRNLNIEVYKVKERNSQRRYAANVIYGDSPGGTVGPDGEVTRRITPLMRQECALALVLHHPNILHTYDILVDADEDKVAIREEAQRLAALFFPTETGKAGADALPLPIVVMPTTRGSKGGVSFVPSPLAGRAKRPQEAASPSSSRRDTHQPTPPHLPTEDDRAPGGDGTAGRDAAAASKLASLMQHVQRGKVLTIFIAELASPFDFLLHCVPRRGSGGAGSSMGSSRRQQRTVTFTAAQAAHLVREAAKGLRYLHTLPPTVANNYFVVHGNLAPHAVMLDVNRRLKICCLSTSGWACHTPVEGRPVGVGMPVYYNAVLDALLAPELYGDVQQRLHRATQHLSERGADGGPLPYLNGFFQLPADVLRRHYGPAIDVWALGIFLYRLVVGELPDVRRRAPAAPGGPVRCEVRLLPTRPAGEGRRRPSLSQAESRAAYLAARPELLDLLQRMLAVDPAQRLSITEVLAHPFLAPKQKDEQR
ncbi:hypothetical protein STCU_10325 [Strigomonas culicis]|uniref:non-specific serine/threonine protein kinase n=1 Tax=Strigomonas culicis TaxID=28005 RepID=S9TND8_9TRYP|nr:hypothetical protein STCU_10325 [Strigomonas culicis]|eukprot:EPY17903.1 hypothetical protein STCU_10325 [Strigomonas culicis]